MDSQPNYTWGTSVVDRCFIDSYSLFIRLHNRLPHYLYIKNFDEKKGYACIREHYATLIKDEYVRNELDCNKKKEEKIFTVIVLENEAIIELGEEYCDIFYSPSASATIMELKEKLTSFKKRARQEPQEINIIGKGEDGLKLMEMEVKRVKLDIGLHYNEDFREMDALIRKRLNKHQDKGIVLLHGEPGTGKTSYLRYLVGKIKKKVMFIPPNLAEHIANPEFIKLLIENPDSVLIIEDAERLITQRTSGSDSPVASMLNISDGLLSDFLNVQVICTFNCPVSMVDDALLRKGRLIARYEFRKLSLDKSKSLSAKLGNAAIINQPLTLAEIFNYHEKPEPTKKARIGFRQGYLIAESV